MDEQERMELRPKYGERLSFAHFTPASIGPASCMGGRLKWNQWLGQKSKPGDLQGKTNSIGPLGRTPEIRLTVTALGS